MRRLTLASGLLVVLLGLVVVGSPPALSQESRTADQFFAGVISASSAEQLMVSRVVQGKNESRSFRITADTKFEGQLAPEARVTVRFITGEDGDIANLVIVRPVPKGKNKK